MGLGWFGYVISIVACGLVLALIGGSTFALYAWAKVRGRRGREPVARVRSLGVANNNDEG